MTTTTEPFAELAAVRQKVDAAVQAIEQRRADDFACKKGCAHCCVGGLTALPVEALSIAAFAESHDLEVSQPDDARCVFLDGEGACQVYPVRPLLCRTHGVPLRGAGEAGRKLRVMNDVTVCELNFTLREPKPEDVLDAQRLQALLVVVDQRFRTAIDWQGEGRLALAELLEDKP